MQNKDVVCNKNNDYEDVVANGVDNSVDNGDDGDDGDNDCDYGADKYLAHLSQEADCCLMERSKHDNH
eukprot:8384795-Ditylum_brightwellii.AAC.2